MATRDLLQKSSQLLKKTSTTPLLDTEVFLCEVLDKPKEFVLANPEFEIPEKQEKKFWEMVERRKKSEPVAYIINKKEFYSLDFFVDKNVLIPRPETEMIVEMVLKITVGAIHELPLPKNKCVDIIDIGTGSGCIIGTIAKKLVGAIHELPLPKMHFFAIDNNSETLKIAKKNFENLGIEKNINVLEGNLLEPYLELENPPTPFTKGVIGEKFSASTEKIILTNLPYLNEEEYKNCAPDVKLYEPKNALYGGKDGLKYIKELLLQIKKANLKNYYLILEISPAQTEFFKNNFSEIEIKKDLFGIDRFAILKS
ncbi:MAG: peptide chain release factor N(5)-glutamine methyltransferase [bacterium]